MTHTTGPWRWSNKGGVLILYAGPGERGVVLRTQPQVGNDYDLSKADAALIVTAPDLLEAAQAALETLDEEALASDNHSRNKLEREHLRDAIAKATGETRTCPNCGGGGGFSDGVCMVCNGSGVATDEQIERSWDGTYNGPS